MSNVPLDPEVLEAIASAVERANPPHGVLASVSRAAGDDSPWKVLVSGSFLYFLTYCAVVLGLYYVTATKAVPWEQFAAGAAAITGAYMAHIHGRYKKRASKGE